MIQKCAGMWQLEIYGRIAKIPLGRPLLRDLNHSARLPANIFWEIPSLKLPITKSALGQPRWAFHKTFHCTGRERVRGKSDGFLAVALLDFWQ